MKMNKVFSSEVDSSMSENKYQKAVKEIGKLVSINTALKRQSMALQERYDSLRVDYDTLRECYEQLEAEAQERVAKQVSNNLKEKQLENTDSISEFVDTKKKLEAVEERLIEKDEKIAQLEKILSEKSEENEALTQKYENLEGQLHRLKAESPKRDVGKIISYNKQLETALEKSEKWVAELSRDYESLKKQSIGADRQKDLIFDSLKGRNPGNGLDMAEEEFKKQKEKYREKVRKYKKKLKECEEENLRLEERVKEMVSFMGKQQSYIEKYAPPVSIFYRN